jgi:hypothetical protein
VTKGGNMRTMMLKVHLKHRQEGGAGYLEAHAKTKEGLDAPLLRRGRERLWKIRQEP